MNDQEILNVCTNALKMLSIREVVLSIKTTTPHTMRTSILNSGHATVLGSRSKSEYRADALFCLVVFNMSEQISNGQLFYNVIRDIINKNKLKGARVEMCIISPQGLSRTAENKIPSLEELIGDAIIEQHSYRIFTKDVTEHVCVPRHTLLSKQEAEYICDSMFVKLEDHPLACKDDPQIVWLGARPGSLVRIDDCSETAAMRVGYRYVTDQMMSF